MSPRTIVMLLAGFIGGLVASACGTSASCTPATCGGCCDAMSKCQSGATAETCGQNGASCGRCGTGTVCQAGECRAGSTGGGGGATGGGTGGGSSTGGGTGGGVTGGGTGGGGCRMIPTMEASQNNLAGAEYRTFTMGVGHYNYAGWAYLTAGNPDAFRLEVVYANDVVPPLSQDFANVVNYRTCTICGIFYENCPSSQQTCTRQYLAQGGTVTITRADRAPAGRLQGSASSVRFNEWNLGTDTAVAGGGCIIAGSIGPIDVGWNADGGAIP